MNIKTSIALGLSVALAPMVAAQSAPTPEEIKKVASYYFGYQFSQQLKSESATLSPSDIDPAIVAEALKQGLEGKQPDPVIWEKLNTVMPVFMESLQKRDEAEGEKNIVAGQKFLEENAKKPGVVTLPSGLQYKVLTEGTGPKYDAQKDGANAVCEVTYEGKLISGKVFDKSDTPVDFPIGALIPGFTEALKNMPTGSTWEIYIPSDLAYGERGPSIIGSNATLIFKLHLIKIKPGAGQSADQPIELTPEMIEQLRAQGLQQVQ